MNSKVKNKTTKPGIGIEIGGMLLPGEKNYTNM
jgi:hypothetical protein